MKSIVYTRTGDQGTTSIVGGIRVSKTCDRLEAYGTIDELNSHIGLLISYISDPHDRDFLTDIQSSLFVVGAYLATDTSQTQLHQQSTVSQDIIQLLESEIDAIDQQLPSLRAFVLPGGTTPSSQCHVCRTVCRRAERRILTLALDTTVDPQVTAYINRLSDYLFVLARKLNIIAGQDEIIWKKTCN